MAKEWSPTYFYRVYGTSPCVNPDEDAEESCRVMNLSRKEHFIMSFNAVADGTSKP
ncbi:hypothetical protein BH11VER1_BH11VER1_37660 [soil metagenome]